MHHDSLSERSCCQGVSAFALAFGAESRLTASFVHINHDHPVSFCPETEAFLCRVRVVTVVLPLTICCAKVRRIRLHDNRHIKQEDKGTQGEEGCVQKQAKTNPSSDSR